MKSPKRLTPFVHGASSRSMQLSIIRWRRAVLCGLLISGLNAGGCAVRRGDIGRAPAMSPVMSPAMTPAMSPIGTGVAALPPAILGPKRAYPQSFASTWRDETADLFTDPRARRVGDVITVKIQIKDKASFDNSTNRQRDSSQSVGGDVNWQTSPNGVDLSGSADAKFRGGTKTEGKGAIARSENIDLLLAAVVTSVLPNGNLFISGAQEVRVNFEVRELSVAGVVRPRDIATDNTVSYDKIAEARISYGGRGRITEVQQPGVVQQIFDIITPF